jgi:hypothetical protein
MKDKAMHVQLAFLKELRQENVRELEDFFEEIAGGLPRETTEECKSAGRARAGATGGLQRENNSGREANSVRKTRSRARREYLNSVRRECQKESAVQIFHRVKSREALTKDARILIQQNEKTDDSIMAKATRPSILKDHRAYQMQHIRDALRFKCVVLNVIDGFRFLQLLTRRWTVVKLDLAKLLTPKLWGWRFMGCDVQMPNGMLVECYVVFKAMEAAKKEGGNHLIFERYRGQDFDALGEQAQGEYLAAAKESTRIYNTAFYETIRSTTKDHFDALFAGFPKKMRLRAKLFYAEFTAENVKEEVQKIGVSDSLYKMLPTASFFQGSAFNLTSRASEFQMFSMTNPLWKVPAKGPSENKKRAQEQHEAQEQAIAELGDEYLADEEELAEDFDAAASAKAGWVLPGRSTARMQPNASPGRMA